METGQGQPTTLRKQTNVLGRKGKPDQNLTVGDRRLSGGIGNKTTVPKGVLWICSQGLEAGRATAR